MSAEYIRTSKLTQRNTAGLIVAATKQPAATITSGEYEASNSTGHANTASETAEVSASDSPPIMVSDVS